MNIQKIVVIFTVVYHEDGIESMCSSCCGALSEGCFAVVAKIDHIPYFVGMNPSVVCCGIVMDAPMLFDDEAKAKDAKEQAMKLVLEKNSVKELNLIPITTRPVIRGTTH